MLWLEGAVLLTRDEVLIWGELGPHALSHLTGCRDLLVDGVYADEVAAMQRAAARITSVSGHEFRTSVSVAEESTSSVDDLPQEITVREAAALLGWTDRHVRRLITAGELSLLRRKPIMLSRPAVVAYKLHRDNEKEQ
jgi:hypothetical protein